MMRITKRHFALALWAALAALPVLANPGNSAGTNRSLDDGESDKVSREKSVSQDKSSGAKASRSRSRDTSRESSREAKQSESTKHERARKQDFSVKLNANPLFIGEFIAEFESDPAAPPVRSESMKSAREFFRTCRPFSNLDADFPVLKADFPTPRAAGNLLRTHSGAGDAEIIPKRFAGSFGNVNNYIKDFLLPPGPENLDNSSIAAYAACRLTAHYFISEAARLTLQVIEERGIPIDSEAKMRGVIRKAYQYLADPENEGVAALWGNIARRSFETWHQARCSPFLGYLSKVGASHNMDCGIFKVAGETVYVEGVPTLSTEAIDGRKFEVALSSGGSDTRTASNEASVSRKESASSKTSVGRETYAEAKRTAGMKAAKSNEATTSTKTGRDAKAEVSAMPRD